MFKLLSAASLDDDSAANKDVQFPLLPCTLSSVHPREDETAGAAERGELHDVSRRRIWLSATHHPRTAAVPSTPPTRHQLTTHRPGLTAFSRPRQIRLRGLPGAATVYVTVKPHVGASTPPHGRRAIHRRN